jgi:hypothetical protein
LGWVVKVKVAVYGQLALAMMNVNEPQMNTNEHKWSGGRIPGITGTHFIFNVYIYIYPLK